MFYFTIFYIQFPLSVFKIDNHLLKNFKNYNMAATYLPSILVPIVGLVFPALSMALFFLYVSVDDID